jgi:hypothetical protein
MRTEQDRGAGPTRDGCACGSFGVPASAGLWAYSAADATCARVSSKNFTLSLATTGRNRYWREPHSGSTVAATAALSSAHTHTSLQSMQWQWSMPGVTSGIDRTFSDVQLGHRFEDASGHILIGRKI